VDRRGNSFDPSVRVKTAASAFYTLGDLVRTKGFLGRTLREDRGVPSVGIFSARRAGVPVDDNGKMRCPPGTPNANQFTDVNMSNCMVPSAETAARAAAELVEQLSKVFPDGFKRGKTTDVVKPKQLTSTPSVGFHDEDGFTAQKRVNVGNTVISPIDGSERKLTKLEDSVTHVAEGGKLTDIPDEHLIEAILANIDMPNEAEKLAIEEVFKNTGVRINGSKPKRFTQIGDGGGINGMRRLKDNQTGALLGIKYENGKGSFADDESYNEVVAEIFGNHFGYEPMPMRLTYGIEEEIGETGLKWNKGHSLVTELAHNRYEGDISSGAVSGDGQSTEISSEEIVRLALFDSVLQNNDRHEQNMLFATDEAGEKSALIPIDQSLAFVNDVNSSEQYGMWVKPVGGAMAIRLEIEAEKYNTVEGRKQMVLDVAKIQEELRAIDTEKLLAQITAARQHFGQMGGQPLPGREKNIEAALARLEVLKNASPEGLVQAMMFRFPAPRQPSPVSLTAWADDITPETSYGEVDI
jgi:hypothetical protein